VLFMHLHRGAVGKVGPMVAILSRPGQARASATVALEAGLRATYEAGELYFDVHT